jgi:hypothetical protein
MIIIGQPVEWINETYYSDEDLWSIVNRCVWRGQQVGLKQGAVPSRKVNKLEFIMTGSRKPSGHCTLAVSQTPDGAKEVTVGLHRISCYPVSDLEALARTGSPSLNEETTLQIALRIGAVVFHDAVASEEGKRGRSAVLVDEERYLKEKKLIHSWGSRGHPTNALTYHVPDCTEGARIRFYRSVRERVKQTELWKGREPLLWSE